MSKEKTPISKLVFETLFLLHFIGLIVRDLSKEEKEILKKVLLKDETR